MPIRAEFFLIKWKSLMSHQSLVPPVDALGVIMYHGMTRNNYRHFRNIMNDHGQNVLSSEHRINKERKYSENGIRSNIMYFLSTD